MSKTYIKEISKIIPMSKSEEHECFIQWKEFNDSRAKEKIYKANLRFVVSVANNYVNKGVPREDLINEGNLAMHEALMRFDYNMNVKFITFAVHYIKMAILTQIARETNIYVLHNTEQVSQINLQKTCDKLEQKLFRKPILEEIQQETNLSIERIKSLLTTTFHNKSIELKIKNTNMSYSKKEYSINDIIPQTTFEDTDNITNPTIELNKFFRQVKLDNKSINILKKHYGIGCQPHTLESLSHEYGQSRERIRQIKETAIKAMQRFNRISEKQRLENIFQS